MRSIGRATTTKGAIDVSSKIANDNLAVENSTSWGVCEQQAGSSIKSEATVFQQMAAQGQTIFDAAGDSGAYDCGGKTTLAVDDPAGQPLVTSVGGTHLNYNATTGAYVSERVWADKASVCQECGGGGGLSVVWKMPSWQVGPGVQNSYSNGMREVPDVALQADVAPGYSVYCTCPGSGNTHGWQSIGGTSLAAPLWAGWEALTNQYLVAHGQPRLGFINPLLYQVGSNATDYATSFHDITTGSNFHYPAATDYDLASGWGSFDAYQLTQTVAALGG